MISTGILLFLATLMATIFIGRTFECMLRKFRKRERSETAKSYQQ
jgi:hypothetical protein